MIAFSLITIFALAVWYFLLRLHPRQIPVEVKLKPLPDVYERPRQRR